MQISSRIEGKVCTVSFTGSMLPDSIEKCEAYLNPLIEDESIQLILINCRNTDTICSTAWGFLLNCNRRLEARQAQFALCERNQLVQTGLTLMGLENALQYFLSEEEALSALNVD